MSRLVDKYDTDCVRQLDRAQLCVPRWRMRLTQELTSSLLEKLLARQELTDTDRAMLEVCTRHITREVLQIGVRGTRHQGLERQVVCYLRRLIKLAEFNEQRE